MMCFGFFTLMAEATKKPGDVTTMWIWFFAAIALAFYFIILRPQKREQRGRQKQLDAVQKGDRIVTVGGIHGRVVEVKQNEKVITVEVAKNVRIDFNKSAVASVVKKTGAADQEKDK